MTDTHVQNATGRVADDIRRLGFRRWHARVLVRAHLYLVTCILGFLLIPIGLALFIDPQTIGERILRYGLSMSGAILTIFGWAQYRNSMILAQRRAERAACPQCGAYGSFEVKTYGVSPANDDGTAAGEAHGWIRVACRRCARQWNI